MLALLWLFVLAAVRVIRSDLFGNSAAQPPVAPQRSPTSAGPIGTAALSAAPISDRPGQRPPRVDGGSHARQLVVTSGPLAGRSVRLDGSPVTLGRADGCTVILGDDYVSNEHARLTPDGDRWLLADLGSTNGTWLGDRKVTEPTPVPLGRPFRVGRTELELRR